MITGLLQSTTQSANWRAGRTRKVAHALQSVMFQSLLQGFFKKSFLLQFLDQNQGQGDTC